MELLVSALEMRELDRQTIGDYGVPGRVLMEVAGRAVAQAASKYLHGAARVVVACGPGNNGGDGFVAARALAAQGHAVSVFVFGQLGALKGDAAAAWKTLDKTAESTITVVEDARGLLGFATALGQTPLVIDALLGTGLNTEVRGLLADAIAVMNDSAAVTVSVDIPSGVDSDTGAILGRAVDADETVTFAYAKRGHYLYPGAGLCGTLTVVDIGIPGALATRLGVVARVVHPSAGPRLIRARHVDSHKGHYGHAVVVAGSAASPGAGILAVRGALRAGAGLVSWATTAAAAERGAAPPEAMLRLRDGLSRDAWITSVLEGATALTVGPGLSREPEHLKDVAELLARAQLPMCLDAEALNLLADQPELWSRLQAPLVVTPHPKEMARLTRSTVQEVQRDRIAAALQLAMARTCVVVLKGAGTVIADPDGLVAVIGAGTPALATGGSGDVLSGIICAMLAQGMEASAAARAAALLHAVAGERAAVRFGVAGTCAGDVAEAIGTVLAEWHR